jgi:hypothetical protein
VVLVAFLSSLLPASPLPISFVSLLLLLRSLRISSLFLRNARCDHITELCLIDRFKFNHEAIMQLQSRLEAIVKQLRSDCEVIAKQARSDCDVNAKRLRSECKAIAERHQGDRCIAIVKRLQSDYIATAIQSRGDQAFAKQSRSDRKTFPSGHEATAKCRQSNYLALLAALPVPVAVRTSFLIPSYPTLAAISSRNCAQVTDPNCICCVTITLQSLWHQITSLIAFLPFQVPVPTRGYWRDSGANPLTEKLSGDSGNSSDDNDIPEKEVYEPDIRKVKPAVEATTLPTEDGNV